MRMMKKSLITLIASLFPVFGCQNIDCIVIDSKSDSCKVLDLDPVFDKYVFSIKDIVDTINVVALETTPSSILSNIDLIKMKEDYIIIKDSYQNGNISVFDNVGRFVCRLPHGNGPGEINSVLSFDIDEHCIYTLQREKVNKYSFYGDFIESYPVVEMHNMYFDGIKAIDGGFLLSVRPYNSRMCKYEVLHVDNAFKKKNLFAFDHHFVGYSGREDFMMLQNQIIFFPTMSNTVYQFDGNTFKPLYMLKYPKHANTFETNPDCSGGSSNFISKHCIDNKFFPEGRIFQSTTVYFLPFLDGSKLYRVFLDSKSGKFRSGIFINNIKEDISVWILSNFRVEYTFNDYLVQILPTEYYLHETSSFGGNHLEESVSQLQHISDEDKQKILNAKEDDNPLIIMYKLKSIE